MTRLGPVFATMSLLMVFGCDRPGDQRLISKQDMIVANVLRQEPSARRFNELFPDSRHFISYVTGHYGPPTWNSATKLYGRYKLQMSASLQIDRQQLTATFSSPPTFHLTEVASISRLPDGRDYVTYGGSWELSAEEWQRLVQAKGDFSVLGLSLIRDDPVPGFQRVEDP
jgi:hypothetical protein